MGRGATFNGITEVPSRLLYVLSSSCSLSLLSFTFSLRYEAKYALKSACDPKEVSHSFPTGQSDRQSSFLATQRHLSFAAFHSFALSHMTQRNDTSFSFFLFFIYFFFFAIFEVFLIKVSVYICWNIPSFVLFFLRSLLLETAHSENCWSSVHTVETRRGWEQFSVT